MDYKKELIRIYKKENNIHSHVYVEDEDLFNWIYKKIMKKVETSNTKTAVLHDTMLYPVFKRMCKYCKNYYGITRSNKGIILQGKCSIKNIMVWKDNYCDKFDHGI